MDITCGNIEHDNADRLCRASAFPNPDWEMGDTEPWVVSVVTALLIASGHRSVVELGGYHGACSQALAETLVKLDAGRLTIMERYGHHCATIRERLAHIPPSVEIEVWEIDVLEGIAKLPDRSVGVAWVDDSHDAPHVIAELEALLPKMADQGLVLFHDVHGAYALHYLVEHYGGVALNLPRVSIGGGLGILQVTERTRQCPRFPRFMRLTNGKQECLSLGPNIDPA